MIIAKKPRRYDQAVEGCSARKQSETFAALSNCAFANNVAHAKWRIVRWAREPRQDSAAITSIVVQK